MKKKTLLTAVCVLMFAAGVFMAAFCFVQINPRASESHLPGRSYAAAGTLAAAILYILSLATAALGLFLSRNGRLRWPRVAGCVQLAAAVILIFPLREYALLDLSPILLLTILYLLCLRGGME